MPDFATAVVQATFPTSGSTLDITGSLGGATPVGAIFLNISAGSGNVPLVGSHALGSIGYTDGVRQRLLGERSRTGQTTTSTTRFTRTNAVIESTFTSATSTDFKASFNSWITNGVRLDLDNLPTLARDFYVIFIYGDLAEVYVQDINQDAGAVSVGFEPDFVLTAGNASSIPGLTNNLIAVLGCAVNDGSDTNRACGLYSRHGVGTSETAGIFDVNNSSLQLTTSLSWTSSIGSFTSTGFTQTASVSGADEIIVMAVKTGGKSVSLDTFTTPTSTGSVKVPSGGVGFTPGSAFFAGTRLETSGSIQTDQTSGSLSFGFCDASDQVTMGWSDEDAQLTSDSDRTLVEGFPRILGIDGNIRADGSVTGFDDGVTVNYSTVHAAAMYGWILTIEEEGGGGGGDPEGNLIGGKLTGGGILTKGRLVGV